MSERTTSPDKDEIWRQPTAAEREVFDMLMSADFVGRQELREQLLKVRVSPLDANGSLSLSSEGPRASVLNRIPVELSYADADDIRVHVLLHVVEMLVDELEFYREDAGAVQTRPRDGAIDLQVNFG